MGCWPAWRRRWCVVRSCSLRIALLSSWRRRLGERTTAPLLSRCPLVSVVDLSVSASTILIRSSRRRLSASNVLRDWRSSLGYLLNVLERAVESTTAWLLVARPLATAPRAVCIVISGGSPVQTRPFPSPSRRAARHVARRVVDAAHSQDAARTPRGGKLSPAHRFALLHAARKAFDRRSASAHESDHCVDEHRGTAPFPQFAASPARRPGRLVSVGQGEVCVESAPRRTNTHAFFAVARRAHRRGNAIMTVGSD